MNRYIVRQLHLLPVKVTNAFQIPTTRAFSTAPLRFASDSTPASTPSNRRVITLTPDNGHKPWANLTRYEKAARTTEQSFNFLTILTGVVMTGGVITFLYLEVFSSDSKTAHFNRVVNIIRKDARCTDLLGRGSDIKAYGEPTWSRWARNRKIAGDFEKDGRGVEQLRMHFNVEGPNNKGTVRLHMTKNPGQKEFTYRKLFLDVPGMPRLVLEDADAKSGPRKADRKFFGVRWG